MAINKTIKEKAFAKINLGLDVLRRREDGYHEVKMVMQSIGICDELTFSTDADIEGMKAKAARLGTNYQTLIKTLVHRYLNGGVTINEAF